MPLTAVTTTLLPLQGAGINFLAVCSSPALRALGRVLNRAYRVTIYVLVSEGMGHCGSHPYACLVFLSSPPLELSHTLFLRPFLGNMDEYSITLCDYLITAS